MKLDEIVARLHAEHPGLSAKLDPAQTRRVVKTLFQVVSDGLSASPDGRVKIQGLGVFKPRPTTPGGALDRFVFRPAKAGADGAAD